jgi:BirA family biotin operon repressor/biotin-[acetyl-CoA-carboxylase] ligase
MALLWPDILLPEFSRLLPFAVGLACCRTVRTFSIDARLKWVNDVLVAEKKIGGILCETVLSPCGERYHVLGLGINVNNTTFPEELQQTAACMADFSSSDTRLDLSEFCGRLLAELHWCLGLLHYDEEQALQEQSGCAEGRTSLLLQEWQRHSDSTGRRVEYGFDVQEKPMYRAVVTGLDPCGGLILQLPDNSKVTEYSGEIRYL